MEVDDSQLKGIDYLRLQDASACNDAYIEVIPLDEFQSLRTAMVDHSIGDLQTLANRPRVHKPSVSWLDPKRLRQRELHRRHRQHARQFNLLYEQTQQYILSLLVEKIVCEHTDPRTSKRRLFIVCSGHLLIQKKVHELGGKYLVASRARIGVGKASGGC